ncbi:hypothetical protein HXX01_04955 [Candidatus Nomurabacteria bacterium]|nr:hypothetical protein [Candidatus Nomurabacteria bacterium]
MHANNKKEISINNDNVKIMNLNDFSPTTREELLAKDLAINLNDRSGFQFYLVVAKLYPEILLRTIAAEVKQIPDKDIKKNRGALFNHLLKKYAQQTRNNSRD